MIYWIHNLYLKIFKSSLEYFKNAGTGLQNQIQNIFEQMSWY